MKHSEIIKEEIIRNKIENHIKVQQTPAVPDIEGEWFGYDIDDKQIGSCQIIQDGNNLTFYDKTMNRKSKGYFLNKNTVIATDWFNLPGHILDNSSIILWCNGNWWVKPTHNYLPCIHGNYCGPLCSKGGEPIDDLDKFCQDHDFCYKKYGYFYKECDVKLVADIEKNMYKFKGYTYFKALIIVSFFKFILGLRPEKLMLTLTHSSIPPEPQLPLTPPPPLFKDEKYKFVDIDYPTKQNWVVEGKYPYTKKIKYIGKVNYGDETYIYFDEDLPPDWVIIQNYHYIMLIKYVGKAKEGDKEIVAIDSPIPSNWKVIYKFSKNNTKIIKYTTINDDLELKTTYRVKENDKEAVSLHNLTDIRALSNEIINYELPTYIKYEILQTCYIKNCRCLIEFKTHRKTSPFFVQKIDGSPESFTVTLTDESGIFVIPCYSIKSMVAINVEQIR